MVGNHSMDASLKPRLSGAGTVTHSGNGWTLSIPAGSGNRYRLAQLDDHLRIARKHYPWYPPMRLELEARISSNSLPGTWGFGLWNDPYGFSCGPGDGFLRLPALPNALWFFYSSPLCYLSFRDDRPGNGFLAQLFSSPRFSNLVIPAALAFPFSRRATRRLLSRVIGEDAVRLDEPRTSSEPAAFDPRAWHRYALEWRADSTRFSVDDARVLETSWSPRPPLGVVIWIDNQHAALTPAGRLSFGLETNPEPAWLEVRDLNTIHTNE